RDPAGFPKLWVHTDFGEAGDGIDLVDENLPVIPKKKIDSSHTFAGQGAEGFKRQRLDHFYNAFGKCGRDHQLRSLFVEILGVIRIEIVPRNDLSGQLSDLILVAENRVLNLQPMDTLFD